MIDGQVSGGALSHFWSLCVEEHFYLVVPLLILCCSIATISRVCVIGCVVAAVGRVAFSLAGNEAGWMLSPLQFDCMLIGIAAAILLSQGSFMGLDRQRFVRLSRWATVACVPVLLLRQVGHDVAFTVQTGLDNFVLSMAVAGGIVTLWTSGAPSVARLLSVRPLPYLGRISYALYLFHLPMLVFAAAWFDFLPAGTSIPAFAMTVILAAVSWRWFEGPINSMRRRFPAPVPTSPPVTQPHRPDVTAVSRRRPATVGARVTPALVGGVEECGRRDAVVAGEGEDGAVEQCREHEVADDGGAAERVAGHRRRPQHARRPRRRRRRPRRRAGRGRRRSTRSRRVDSVVGALTTAA